MKQAWTRAVGTTWIVAAALAASSCSEDVAAPAEAGIRVGISPAPQQACNVLGGVTVGPAVPTSSTEEGTPIKDGQEGAVVACSVKGSGSYSISASVSHKNNGFLFTGSIGSNGEGTLTTAAFFSPAIGNLEAQMPCTIVAKPLLSGDKLRVVPGELFAQVSCPLVRDPSLPGATNCAADRFFVLLKNCDK
jgi:hypothetical protein